MFYYVFFSDISHMYIVHTNVYCRLDMLLPFFPDPALRAIATPERSRHQHHRGFLECRCELAFDLRQILCTVLYQLKNKFKSVRSSILPIYIVLLSTNIIRPPISNRESWCSDNVHCTYFQIFRECECKMHWTMYSVIKINHMQDANVTHTTHNTPVGYCHPPLILFTLHRC